MEVYQVKITVRSKREDGRSQVHHIMNEGKQDAQTAEQLRDDEGFAKNESSKGNDFHL
jgi:hypothetical protein